MSDKDISKTQAVNTNKKVIQTENVQAELSDTSTVSKITYLLAAVMTRFAWEIDKSVE